MLDFQVFDADNHYYEPVDAFTRHLDPSMRKRTMQWAEIDGKQRLLVGGQVNRFIPNPTFARVSKPGALADYFRAKDGVGDLRAAFGELEPIEERPEYRDRDARLEVMDSQGIEATIMLPTLGVGMEAALEHDPEACTAAFSSFNQWLLDDWGYAFEDRIFAAPYLSLIDVDWAVRELDHAAEHGARVVLMRPASVWAPGGRRSPGHHDHLRFWDRLQELDLTLVIHGGESSYTAYEQMWGLAGETEAFRIPALKRLLSASPIHDMMASLIADKVLERHPGIRVATIETGSGWVGPLIKRLKNLHIQMPGTFDVDPVEVFTGQVWVSPFFEDDVHKLIGVVGPDRVVFGSDWPHAEGLSEPTSFVEELDGVAADDVRKIMRDNAWSLVRPAA